jgi:hypothetical protein
VAIDRTSRSAFAEPHEKAATRVSGDCLRHLVEAAPCRVPTVLAADHRLQRIAQSNLRIEAVQDGGADQSGGDSPVLAAALAAREERGLSRHGHRCPATRRNLRGGAPKPVEDLREFLRADFLSHRVRDSYGAIVDACCHAWDALMSALERVTSIAARAWAQVSA